MAKNKRPKWLDAETPELLNTLKEILAADEITEKDQTKASKIVEELIARIPTGDAAPLSVIEAIAAAQTCIETALEGVKAAYDNEVATIADTEVEEEEEDEAPAPPPKKKDKKSKKTAKVEEPEDEEEEEEEPEEDEEEESDEDYSDWSTKDLKKECRNRGIKVTKSMGKAELVKALEADDKE